MLKRTEGFESSSVVRRFIQDLITHRQLKLRTMQQKISTLKSFSKYCLKEKWIVSDFMSGIITPKSDQKLPIYMNMEELKQLFTSLVATEHPLALRNEAMFKLLTTTGMWRQELVDLTWE